MGFQFNPDIARAAATGATASALLPVPFPAGGTIAVGYEYYQKGRMPRVSEWMDVTQLYLAGMAGSLGVQLASSYPSPLGIVMPVFPRVPQALGIM